MRVGGKNDLKIGDIFKKKNDNQDQRKISLENVLIILIVCGVTIPMLTQSIMCNDELQYYYWSRQGFRKAVTHFQEGWISQGRFLASLFTPIWMWLSVVCENTVVFRCISIITILLNTSLFCKLIELLFESKPFAKMCFVGLLTFLPISYTPMAPNAYVVCFGIPFLCLLISMIIYAKNLNNMKMKDIILMAIFMFVAFSSYEIFVTYVPLYCLIAIYKMEIKNYKKIFQASLPPVIIGCIYIVLYVFCRIIMPSYYPGNNISFTLQGVVDILKHLCGVSFPGYFLGNSHMQYLNNIMRNVQVIDYFRIFIVAIGTVVLIYIYILEKKREYTNHWFIDICIVMVAFLYTFLPALPISISGMYQNNVGSNTGFLALPVTYFTYYAAVFLCCYLLWKLLENCHKLFGIMLIIICVCFVQIPVQYMNSNISIEQHNSYEKIQRIEKFFKTNYIKSMPGVKIYSEDIFETHYSLGIHDSYWQDTMNILGINIVIQKESKEKALIDDEYYLRYNNDYFFMESNELIIIANEQIMEEVILELKNGKLIKVKLSEPYIDEGYYVYELNKKDC